MALEYTKRSPNRPGQLALRACCAALALVLCVLASLGCRGAVPGATLPASQANDSPLAGLFSSKPLLEMPVIDYPIFQRPLLNPLLPADAKPGSSAAQTPSKTVANPFQFLKKEPSNEGNWVPELKELALAKYDADRQTVQIHNVRNCEFLTYRDCLVDYYDATYDLNKLQTVDFIVVPFKGNKAIAHTMLSFGFEGGKHVGISAEVRLEKGEQYAAALGLFGQFELIYVVADERDLIRARTEHRDVDVFVYRSTATPEQGRKLFLDMLARVNQLHDHPEFYDTLSNNCTTNIVRHINNMAPGKIPHDYRVLLPGYADRLAYELGLIDTSLPFDEVRRRARINDLALKYKDSPDFSARIRGEQVAR